MEGGGIPLGLVALCGVCPSPHPSSQTCSPSTHPSPPFPLYPRHCCSILNTENTLQKSPSLTHLRRALQTRTCTHYRGKHQPFIGTTGFRKHTHTHRHTHIHTHTQLHPRPSLGLRGVPQQMMDVTGTRLHRGWGAPSELMAYSLKQLSGVLRGP